MKQIFLLFIITCILAACNKDNKTQELSLSNNELSFNYSAETSEITVTANIGWTTRVAADWITLTPPEGRGNVTLNVSVSANT